MKIDKYTYKYVEHDVAEELNISILKLRKILTRYNIIQGGFARTEFELRGLMSNTNVYFGESRTTENVLEFSEKGKWWVKKLITLLDSDISKSDWVE